LIVNGKFCGNEPGSGMEMQHVLAAC